MTALPRFVSRAAALALIISLAAACGDAEGGATGPASDAVTDLGAGALDAGIDAAVGADATRAGDPGSGDAGLAEDTAVVADTPSAADVPMTVDVVTPDAGGSVDAGGPVDAGVASDTGAAQDAPEADAAAAGACTNADDTQALATAQDIAGAMQGCAMSCLQAGAGCTSCIQGALDVSEPCAGCFSDMMGCTIANCALNCLDPSSTACQECQLGACFPAFEACAGISPPG